MYVIVVIHEEFGEGNNIGIGGSGDVGRGDLRKEIFGE